jgi:hypothetical protein
MEDIDTVIKFLAQSNRFFMALVLPKLFMAMTPIKAMTESTFTSASFWM